MRWILAGLLCLSVAVPSVLVAQDTRDAELATSDQDLNATYRKLMRQLKPADQNGLRLAQRAWVAYRDADCAWISGDRRECLMERTDQREEQLKELLETQ